MYRVDARRIVEGGALSSGGNVFAWLQSTLRLGSPNSLQEELASMAPDCHGLTVLPFLAGERSPGWHSDARAAITGMSLDTGPVEIARAALEAVAYQFGNIFGLLLRANPMPDGVIGSGSALLHSQLWVQILADVLATPMTICTAPEATSRGAVLLALESMAVLTDLRDVPVPLGTKYAPHPEHTEVYRAAMERQSVLYRRLQVER
jgi:gluconokinase